MKVFTIIRYRYFFIILILLFSQNYHASAQTKWYKYPGNPVFYLGKEGEWDHRLESAVVRFHNGKYHMWYAGWKKSTYRYGDVGYATSDDCIHWEKYEGNPLKFNCDGTPWDTCIWGIEVLIIDSMYYMWYNGQSKDNNSFDNIGYAWSEDGINWTKRSEPVLRGGQKESWHNGDIAVRAIVYNDKGYHMWYSGHVSTIPICYKTGYATSKDGIHWEIYPGNPILELGPPGSFDEAWVIARCVSYEGSNYKMWYVGFNRWQSEIGYATSKDGIHWIKYSGNPVLNYGDLGSWDDWFVVAQEVIIEDSVYKMIFMGADTYRGRNYGYATTSVTEAEAWDTLGAEILSSEIRVQILNRVDYIKADSLKHILHTLSGTVLVDAYNKLALAFSVKNEEKSFEYAKKALNLASELNYPGGKAMAYYSMGNSEYVFDNYADALANQLSALRLFDSLGMHYEVGNLLSQIATIHTYTGSHELAIKYYEDAIKSFEKINDTTSILYIMDHLGYAYRISGDTSNAIIIHHKRLFLAKDCNDLSTQAIAYIPWDKLLGK